MIDALADLARRLVACDTTSAKSNLPAIELLADRLQALGFRTRVQSWQADGSRQGEPRPTAGPAEPGGLASPAIPIRFRGRSSPDGRAMRCPLEIGDERVYGRGASDMKPSSRSRGGGGQISDRGLSRPLVLLLTADEEVGCLGAARTRSRADDSPRRPAANVLLDRRADLLGSLQRPQVDRHLRRVRARSNRTQRSPELGLERDWCGGDGAHRDRTVPSRAALESVARRFATSSRVPYATVNLGTIPAARAANMIAEQCVIRMARARSPMPTLSNLSRDRAAPRDAGRARSGRSGRQRANLTRRTAGRSGMLAPRGTELEAALLRAARLPRGTRGITRRRRLSLPIGRRAIVDLRSGRLRRGASAETRASLACIRGRRRRHPLGHSSGCASREGRCAGPRRGQKEIHQRLARRPSREATTRRPKSMALRTMARVLSAPCKRAQPPPV